MCKILNGHVRSIEKYGMNYVCREYRYISTEVSISLVPRYRRIRAFYNSPKKNIGLAVVDVKRSWRQLPRT